MPDSASWYAPAGTRWVVTAVAPDGPEIVAPLGGGAAPPVAVSVHRFAGAVPLATDLTSVSVARGVYVLVNVHVTPGLAAFSGGGMLVRVTWRAPRLIVALRIGCVVPFAASSVHTSPVNTQRSSPGSVSVTPTVLLLVTAAVRLSAPASENEPLVHGEPASVEEEVKAKLRAGGVEVAGVPTVVLTIVSERAWTSVA